VRPLRPPSNLRGILAFGGLLACLSLRFHSYLFPSELVDDFLLGLTLLLGVLFAACFRWTWSGTGEPTVDGPAWLKAGLCALWVGWLAFLMAGSADMSPWIVAVLGATLLASLATPFAPPSLLRPAAVAVAATTVLGAVLIVGRPFAENPGDMMALVDRGVDRFLAGEFPYRDLRVEGMAELEYSARPMPYPPALWLSYVPLAAVGLDLRWLSVLAVAGIGYLLRASAVRAGRDDLADWMLPPLLLAPIFVLRYPWIQTPIHWLLLVGTGLCLLRGAGPRWVGLLCGLALGMRETTLILLPLVALHFWKLGRRLFVEFAVVGGVVVLAVYGPFLLIDPAAFASSLLYNALYVTQLERPLNHIGAGPWLANLFGSRMVLLLQIGVCFAFFVLIWRQAANATRLVASLGLLYFSFMYLNTLVHEYYYLPALILMALAHLSTDGRTDAAPRP